MPNRGEKRYPINFSGSDILHPDVGVSIAKSKQDRPKVPEKVLHLMHSWQVAYQCSLLDPDRGLLEESVSDSSNKLPLPPEPLETNRDAFESVAKHRRILDAAASSSSATCARQVLNSSLMSCSYCDRSTSWRIDSASVGQCRQCCLCLLFWHADCAQSFADSIWSIEAPVLTPVLTTPAEAEAASSSFSSSPASEPPNMVMKYHLHCGTSKHLKAVHCHCMKIQAAWRNLRLPQEFIPVDARDRRPGIFSNDFPVRAVLRYSCRNKMEEQQQFQ